MTGLLGPNGQPISSVQFKKDPPPVLGDESFAPWAGRDLEFMQMPGGSLVQFDLSKLRLEDYRNMRDHYQVNSSLAVLSFMQHQSDWQIECSDKKITDACTEQLEAIWTSLNRSLGTANWAGYSPNAFDWNNDVNSKQVKITKVKDLVPEECSVHWKLVKGWAPAGRVKPKYKIYDGINYAAQPGWPIPVENSFWYPLLMENGDYYGKKLLRPAFQSWFFSILIHLFANRYFERFGEPVPVGRAPFDEEVELPTTGGTKRVRGNEYLLGVLRDLRNRSVVVLPNDKSQVGANGQLAFDYEIEYLESQMRGADFERYLTRLDEEISLGLFTPILLLRTADVGSYNLGVGHMQVYLWMLNAMNDDRAQYIDKYILNKFVNYNFSPNAPRARIKFRKMGNSDTDMIKQILVALISAGRAKPDLDELGQIAGLSLKEIQQTVADPNATDPNSTDTSTGNLSGDQTESAPNAAAILSEILARVDGQVSSAFRDHKFNKNFRVNMGYKKSFKKALERDGVENSVGATEMFYSRLDAWLGDAVALGETEFSGPESFNSKFEQVASYELARISRA
jgi:hypothetical protein